MQSARAYWHLWPVWLHHIFQHHHINGTIFGKQLLNIKRFWFWLQLLSQIFLILRIIQQDTMTTVKTYSRKVPVIVVRFSWHLNFLDRFSKEAQMSNFIKNLSPVSRVVSYRRADITLLIAFRNFENTPTKAPHFKQTSSQKLSV